MPQRGFLVVFGLFWSAITGLFLVLVVHGIVKQLEATSFARTDGIVDKVEETISRGSKSTTYGVKIVYHYTVNGQRYSGDKLRFGQSSSSHKWAQGMVQRFAAGTHPPVYYNPADPAEAVLIPGIQGEDLFLALFLTPFALIMLAIWAALAMSFRRTKGFLGLQVLEELNVTRIRPSAWIALGAAAAAMGLSAFVSIFVVAFLFGGFDPSLSVAGGAWTVVLSAAVLTGAWKFSRIRSGAEDVVLDDAGKWLTAPKAVRVPYASIGGVHVITKVTTTSKGGTTRTYEVWIHYTQDGKAKRLKLEKWSEQAEEARRFAAWLGLQLGVAVVDGHSSLITGPGAA